MEKLKQSVIGVWLGFLILVAALGFLVINEIDAVKELSKLDEIDKVAIEMKSDDTSPENDGKLVVIGGTIKNDGKSTDDAFSIEVNSPKLLRTVEVYQWKETLKDKVYTYDKVWSKELVD